ncbi:MAG TPA: hypothetical protein VNK44_04130 [Candidatus Nitrosotenuis sp.]|nr:hypothetical protein [Candidatus Nitrosotenuis sp.]
MAKKPKNQLSFLKNTHKFTYHSEKPITNKIRTFVGEFIVFDYITKNLLGTHSTKKITILCEQGFILYSINNNNFTRFVENFPKITMMREPHNGMWNISNRYAVVNGYHKLIF